MELAKTAEERRTLEGAYNRLQEALKVSQESRYISDNLRSVIDRRSDDGAPKKEESPYSTADAVIPDMVDIFYNIAQEIIDTTRATERNIDYVANKLV